MRSFILLASIAATLPAPASAEPLAPAIQQLQVQARPDVPDLTCEAKPSTPRPAAAPNPDPLEVPTDDMVRATSDGFELQMTLPPPAEPAAPTLRPAGGTQRIAIWGDSHLAAGFFTEELARQLKVPADNVSNVLLPANMGRAGVRLPIRRACVSPQWKYELGYLGGDGARLPGPGLVNMVTDQAGATLAWDLRGDKRAANYEHVRILYQQTEAPIVVGVSVDGADEMQVTLGQRPGPAVLELAAEQPLTQVKLRLITGAMRFHGLDLQARRAGPLTMDVFGYPGATVASWKAAQLDYLGAWFGARDYQLVMLEFGTNEGAVKPFDGRAYRKMLEASVHNMRTVFPNAACVLIAPGDRGILVPQSLNIRKRAKGKKKAAPKIDLFVYARIHAEIGRIQRDVAREAGCSAWSMMEAMGGPGQSYAWVHRAPPLMAKDLTHFTVGGYQRFAQKLAHDMGWTAGGSEAADDGR